MVYWKLDDKTIRCLINKDEIAQMGYDLGTLSEDASVMSDFLDAIVDESHKYIDWNTENGVQNYITRALPADQYLITISCTFQDEAINQDLDQIRRILNAMNHKISNERLDEIEHLTGEEKENAFASLSKDLHDVYTGRSGEDTSSDSQSQSLPVSSTEATLAEDGKAQITQESASAKEILPAQKLTFESMSSLMEFSSLLDERHYFHSQLYRYHEKYILLVDFTETDDKVDVISFLITAEEYGAKCEAQAYSRYYLQEHASLLISENAIATLEELSR